MSIAVMAHSGVNNGDFFTGNRWCSMMCAATFVRQGQVLASGLVRCRREQHS
jgi:hypothetical protein